MAETLGPRRLSGKRRYLLLLVPPLLVVIALSGVLFLFSQPNSERELDADLCALEPAQSAGRAVLLLDFRKPTEEANLGELVHDVSRHLDADTELRVFAISSDPLDPRLQLDRICKPYDNADLQIDTAKDQGDTARDCDDLPAQLPSRVREAANRFCGHRDALHKRVVALARNQPATPVASSYLMEALEDTVIDLAEGSGPRTIYVFSDMMQHATWYSHLDLEWTEWNYADFAATRAALTTRMGRRPSASDLTVRVYYPPRVDLTEHPRAKRAHQDFWQEYFADAELAFLEQPVLPAYAAISLMDRLTPEELITQEREAIERERAEAQRMLAEVQREREALEEEQRRLAEERNRATAPPRAEPQRAAELRQQQRALVDQREQLEEREAQARELAMEEPAEEPTPPPPEVAEQPPASATEDVSEAEDVSVSDEVEPEEASEPEEVSEPDDVSEPESIGQLALATDQSAETALPPCEARLLPRFLEEAATDIYPGRRRMNYGSASVVIRYTVDEAGATIDDEVALVPEESSAQRPRSLDLFADAAKRVVRNWIFEFEGNDEGNCSRRQERSIQFEFRYD